MVATFTNYQELVDRALMIEGKQQQIENRKRKYGQGKYNSGAYQKPRYSPYSGGHNHNCRCSGNGGPQTCLPAAHGMALLAGLYGPSSSTRNQDPREGPSLVRRTTQDLLRSGLTRLAREGWRVQGWANLARFS